MDLLVIQARQDQRVQPVKPALQEPRAQQELPALQEPLVQRDQPEPQEQREPLVQQVQRVPLV